MDRATALKLAKRADQDERTAAKAGRVIAARNARIRAATYRAIAARQVAKAGQYRLNLAAERARRVIDAKAQPRTPVTRHQFWFKSIKRTAVRRRPIDSESREYYQEKDYELEQDQVGIRAEITSLTADLSRDKYDRGGAVSKASIRRQNVKARDVYGHRYTDREVTNTSLYRQMRAKLTELRADLRDATAKRTEIRDVMRYGELPGHYRKRMAAPRRRRR
jgi:hypothetical protein